MHRLLAGAALVLSSAGSSAYAAWIAPIQLNQNVAGRDQQQPDIERAPGGAIYVVWSANLDADTADFDIYFRCSVDGGVNWVPDLILPPRLLGPASGFPDTSPRIATSLSADGTTIHVVVASILDGVDINLFRDDVPVGSPCSVAFPGGTVDVVGGANPQTQVDVAVDQAGNAYLAYFHNPGGPTDFVRFGRVLQAATVLSDEFDLSAGSVAAQAPAILVSGATAATSEVVVTWHEADDAADGGKNVRLRWHHDGGAVSAWSAVDTLDAGAVALEQAVLDFHAFTDDAPSVWQVWSRGAAEIRSRIVSLAGLGAPASVQVESRVDTLDNTFAPINPAVAALPNVRDALVTYDLNKLSPSFSDIYSSVTDDGGATPWVGSVVTSTANTQGFSRAAIGDDPTETRSAFVVFESDRDVLNEKEVFFSADSPPQVTVVRVEGLGAEWVDTDSTRVSWYLSAPTGVESMRVLRNDTDQVGDTIAPGLESSYAIVDDPGGRSPLYRLEVRLFDGSTETYGPVSPGDAPRRDAGCGQGFWAALLLAAVLRGRTLARQ